MSTDEQPHPRIFLGHYHGRPAYRVDLREFGGQRVVLRDPTARGWRPGGRCRNGGTTAHHPTARGWAWCYLAAHGVELPPHAADEIAAAHEARRQSRHQRLLLRLGHRLRHLLAQRGGPRVHR